MIILDLRRELDAFPDDAVVLALGLLVETAQGDRWVLDHLPEDEEEVRA